MKEVTVLSGKGGTGKTTLLASFAALAPGSITADCDVDAPNLHLLLSGERVEEGPFSASQVASIDMVACTHCRCCADACRFGAVHLDDPVRGPFVEGLSCEGCHLCWRLCPSEAIAMRDRTSGHWMVTRTPQGMMFHARLDPGEGNSGKLVSLLKRKARAYGKSNGTPLLLVDGPPGIGCAAIASLSGADLAILVTEPTRSGLSDLERVVRLCRQMDVRPAVVINRWDLSPPLAEEIEQWARGEGAVILGRIPFDDAVHRCMASGIVVVSSPSPAGAAIREVWRRAAGFL